MRVVLAQLKSDVEELSRQIKLEYSYHDSTSLSQASQG